MSHNCPNCGAPINTVQCPYCGTVLYDFAALDIDHPTYVRINFRGHVITFRSVVRNVTMELSFDALPGVTIELMGIPDANGNNFIEEKKK